MNQSNTIVGGQRQRNQTSFFADVQQYHPTMPSSTNQQSKKRGSSTALTTTTNNNNTTTNNKKKSGKKKSKKSGGGTITFLNISISAKANYDKPLEENTNAIAHRIAAMMHNAEIIFRATFMKEIEINGEMVNIGNFLQRVEVDISHLPENMRKGLNKLLEKKNILPGFECTPYIVNLLEEIKCADEDGERIPDKELYDMTVKEQKDTLKRAKNTHGLKGEAAKTFVKFKLFLRFMQKNCEMYLWDGSHFGKLPNNQACWDRKNGRTPDITYKPFSMDLKFVLVHPFFTKKKYKGIVHNEVENPEWRPRPDLWDAKK